MAYRQNSGCVVDSLDDGRTCALCRSRIFSSKEYTQTLQIT